MQYVETSFSAPLKPAGAECDPIQPLLHRFSPRLSRWPGPISIDFHVLSSYVLEFGRIRSPIELQSVYPRIQPVSLWAGDRQNQRVMRPGEFAVRVTLHGLHIQMKHLALQRTADG